MKDMILREMIVDMAYEIIAMHEEAQQMEHYKTEAKETQNKFSDYVKNDIQSGEQMMSGILELVLTHDIPPRKEATELMPIN